MNPSPPKRVCVVLFNLGGPDGPDDVEPFLRNLFSDAAIISLPGLIRRPLAALIAKRRAPSARENYAKMGGGSPLKRETEIQAQALAAALKRARPGVEFQVVVAMRYWSPFVADAVKTVQAMKPDAVVLLPLYPHFSTTTTQSSVEAWIKAGGSRSTHTICCYPDDADFITAHAARIAQTWREAGAPTNVRLLFSAHGLPERVIEKGDPYQWQIERTAAAVAARLPALPDWSVCYQSRVGPLKWIGPSTEDAIDQAAADGRGVLVAPIAFVSEHIETLVELDDEYAERAHKLDVAPYLRAPALGVEPSFISALSRLTLDALDAPAGLRPPGGRRICPGACGACPNRSAR